MRWINGINSVLLTSRWNGIEVNGAKKLDETRFVIFDAVSTIIYPEPDVFSAYHSHGQKFGSRLTRDEVKKRFHQLRKELFDSELLPEEIDFESVELVSSDQIEFDLWRCLVERLFVDVADPLGLFHALWSHFAMGSSWRVFPDVQPCWDRLQSFGFKIGIASNFDSRLFELCKRLPPLDQADLIVCSAKTGSRKPDKRFFRSIESQIESQIASQHPNSQLTMFMVGDDAVNDVLAPRLLGWRSFHIDRKCSQNCGETLRTLDELPELLSASKNS